jgi:hypothetical protein
MKVQLGILNRRFGLESIDFQDGSFFKDLTKAIENLQSDKEAKKYKKKDFYTCKGVKAVVDVVKEHTKINVWFSDGGPAIYTPNINASHIFYDHEMIEMFEWEKEAEKDVTQLMKKLKVNAITGIVDMRNSKVGGAFEKMLFNVMMPYDMLTRTTFPADEVAAILIHEIGHAFTFLEYACRQITTNHALQNLVRILDKSFDNEKRVMLFDQAAKSMEMSAERTRALKECKTAEQLTVVVMDQAVSHCKSELGGSVYDVNSCEYLADQFAARHGAGRALVTGLDRLFKDYGMTQREMNFAENAFWVFMLITSAMTMGMAFPVWALLVIFGPDKSAEIYDNANARMNRVKLQIVEKLKDPNIEGATRAMLLDEVKAIEKCMENYDDELTRTEKVAYFFRPAYRKAHDIEQIQKDLEKLAASDMFVTAAKLKMI